MRSTPPARVEVFLDRHLVFAPALEVSAHADVQAFGVFAENHEVHVAFGTVLEGAEPFVEEFHGALVHIEVQREADSEENIDGVLVGGDTRVAQCPD
jgi:hypothetical protein